MGRKWHRYQPIREANPLGVVNNQTGQLIGQQAFPPLVPLIFESCRDFPANTTR